MELDFSDDFTSYTPESLEIRVGGRSLFTTISSVAFGAGVGSLYASNSTRDTLALTFDADTWIGFDQATIVNGQLVFGTLNQFLFGASGTVSRVSGPPIIDPPPPVIDPPVPVSSAAVPELSTWAMMLIGLAGLGFAARRRGRLGLPGERA
jgi:MYXO-CTERM domain-containing protein